MNYRFVKMESTTSFIKLVLRTEDPLLYRVGRVEDFTDVDPRELDLLVEKTLARENRRAIRVKNFLQSTERETLLQKELENLKGQACELYEGMQKHFEEKEVLFQLNQEFNELMVRDRIFRRAFSYSNPWLKTYLKKRDYTDTKRVRQLLDHILVYATITDQEWLRNPIYPEERAYTKGMRLAKGQVLKTPESAQAEKKGLEPIRDVQGKPKKGQRRPGSGKSSSRTSRAGKEGRKEGRTIRRRSNCKNVLREEYKEPELKISSVEVHLRYLQYRDVLPAFWLEGMDEP